MPSFYRYRKHEGSLTVGKNAIAWDGQCKGETYEADDLKCGRCGRVGLTVFGDKVVYSHAHGYCRLFFIGCPDCVVGWTGLEGVTKEEGAELAAKLMLPWPPPRVD